MAFSGFGKNSGPGGASRPETPFGQFPRAPSPPRPLPAGNLHPSTWGDEKASLYRQHSPQTYQRPPNLHPQVLPSNPRNGAPAETKYMGRTGSPYSRSPEEPSYNPRGVINRAQSPLVYEKNQYVRGQIPRTEVQLHSYSSPVRGSQLRPSNYNITPSPPKGISSMSTADVTYKSRPIFQSNHAIVPLSKQTISPTHPSRSGVSPDRTMFHPHEHKRSVIDYRDLDAPEEMPSPSLPIERNSSERDTSHSVGNENPFTSSPVWTSQTNFSTDTIPQNEERMSSALTATGVYKMPQTRNADVPLPKRTRSPTFSSAGGGFQQNPAINLGDNRRAPDFQNQSQSPTSRISNRIEIAVDSSMQFPAVKRTKIPIPSSSDAVQDNLDQALEDRELHAKAKRLARFKDELSQPVQSDSIIRNQKVPAKKQHQFLHEKHKFSEEPMVDAMGDSAGGDSFSDYEGMASPSLIVGLCPDMCPESERAERERKGDLDQYERLDGDRNLSSEFLAVKKYTRTAEREAMLIRPMPILQKTMGYLLNLLSEPYDDRFLGLYNFLWDRMRAIRMDLRMQHIFNLEAIKMLEQMIRLHIIAMHELCEYTKGEGFSEGFDAHLNIEQMNKTSVELFQLYDDHRKRGIHVPSECEFRGYYALLKLDKHPGYKVEPAELSLDLAKMTPEIRQTPEVLFARDVARACRTGNFISFFRLANKASYLQACLMHAHFSKLRTQALASLYSGLQMNQGIPVAHVAKWLGMEEEDMEKLLEYHGFSVKDFEEPYMMKENAFMNADSDFPVRRSQLVVRKQSGMIADDVSNPSLSESYVAEKVSGIQIKKGPELTTSKTTPTITPVSSSQLHDEEMHNVGTISSPKGSMQMPHYNASVYLETPEENLVRQEVQVAPASPFVFSFSSGSPASYQNKVESSQKPKYESVFRNSFGRTKKQDLDLTSPMISDTAEEIRYSVLPLDSVVHTPILQPSFNIDLQDEELTGTLEEDESDEVSTSYYDKEVAEARLKLILRIWKRRAIKKKELRERKQLAANTAMSLLPMGPPIWHFEAPSSIYGMFNIDHVMSKRQEIQERSWSVLNPSYVVADKLVDRNPDAECLCWKVVVCSQEEIPVEYNITQQNKLPISSLSSWFLSKLMPASYDVDGDLLLSSPGVAIWRGWIPGQSGVGPICCLSVIKDTTFDDLNEAITGANAVLFPLLENIPLELQKKRLHNLIASIPYGARMPLLILSDAGEEELDASSVAKDLGLSDIDKSTIVAYNIIFLKDKGKGKMDVFFSDERLREGLEWVASESPQQIAVREIKMRDLVFHHLSSTLGILNETIARGGGPNNCIEAFNEALDRSMKDVATAVDANPTGWPCPEIGLLEQSSDEYRVVACYLPSTGWSSPSKTDLVMRTLDGSMLPAFEDDLHWLSTGLNVRDDFEDKKSRLENCLIDYLTTTCQIMGVALAQKEVMAMLQNCARLELHSSTYYIVPEWVSIFRRIFNWRLMNLTSGEVCSTYVLEHYPRQCLSTLSSNFLDMETKGIPLLPPYMAHPSLDELVEVGHAEVLCFQPDLIEPHDASRAWPAAYTDVPASNTSAILMQNEERSTKDNSVLSDNHLIPEANNGVDQQPTSASKGSKEADKLSELLEKCNVMQNLIDKKLSIYF